MIPQCTVELTEGQIKELESLQYIAVEAAKRGEKGVIIAQVFPGTKGVMHCIFCPNNMVTKIYDALGKDPPV